MKIAVFDCPHNPDLFNLDVYVPSACNEEPPQICSIILTRAELAQLHADLGEILKTHLKHVI